jgi:hypothetical protein
MDFWLLFLLIAYGVIAGAVGIDLAIARSNEKGKSSSANNRRLFFLILAFVLPWLIPSLWLGYLAFLLFASFASPTAEKFIVQMFRKISFKNTN